MSSFSTRPGVSFGWTSELWELEWTKSSVGTLGCEKSVYFMIGWCLIIWMGLPSEEMITPFHQDWLDLPFTPIILLPYHDLLSDDATDGHHCHTTTILEQ